MMEFSRNDTTVYILPPSIPKRIEGYRWQEFYSAIAALRKSPSASAGLICHRRTQFAAVDDSYNLPKKQTMVSVSAPGSCEN